MLRVDQVHVIRYKVLVEGQSQGRVARELQTGCSHPRLRTTGLPE
jgi:hypothetical protein